jgi:hypothetical protein
MEINMKQHRFRESIGKRKVSMAGSYKKLTDSELVQVLEKALPLLKYDLGGAEYERDLRIILEAFKKSDDFAGDNFSIFGYSAFGKGGDNDITFDLWRVAVSGAVHVLKWHDRRENPSGSAASLTTPIVDELINYYRGLRQYEPVLYGTDPRYRDHFAHVLRVWMTGIFIINRIGTKKLEPPSLAGKNLDHELFTGAELCAMFTIAALTHDMGYPLQKVTKLNDAVGNLLQSFGGVDWQQLKVTLSFPQHTFAQELLKLLSSNPRFRTEPGNNRMNAKIAAARAEKLWKQYKLCKSIDDYKEKHKDLNWAVMLRSQWKYHQKYARSLEQHQHGFLSALLLQRKLLYFREGEFALEEDYPFKLEEARQFMIRRDILRAVTSHTCSDIYFLSPLSTEALLFFCDEIQDWGRPYFRDLYGLDVCLETPVVRLGDFGPTNVSWSIELAEADISTLSWKIFSTVQALYIRLRSAPESEGRRFGVQWKATVANQALEAYFGFEKKTKKYRAFVKNVTTKHQEDMMPILKTFYAGAMLQKDCVQVLQNKLKAIQT